MGKRTIGRKGKEIEEGIEKTNRKCEREIFI